MQRINIRKIIGFILLFPFLVDAFLILTDKVGGFGVYSCADCIGEFLFAVIIGLPLFAVGLYLLIPRGDGNYLVGGFKFLSKLLAVLAILFALYMLFSVFGGDFLYNTFGINL